MRTSQASTLGRDLRGKNVEAGNISKKIVVANQGQVLGAELWRCWRKWRRDRCHRHC